MTYSLGVDGQYSARIYWAGCIKWHWRDNEVKHNDIRLCIDTYKRSEDNRRQTLSRLEDLMHYGS